MTATITQPINTLSGIRLPRLRHQMKKPYCRIDEQYLPACNMKLVEIQARTGCSLTLTKCMRSPESCQRFMHWIKRIAAGAAKTKM